MPALHGGGIVVLRCQRRLRGRIRREGALPPPGAPLPSRRIRKLTQNGLGKSLDKAPSPPPPPSHDVTRSNWFGQRPRSPEKDATHDEARARTATRGLSP